MVEIAILREKDTGINNGRGGNFKVYTFSPTPGQESQILKAERVLSAFCGRCPSREACNPIQHTGRGSISIHGTELTASSCLIPKGGKDLVVAVGAQAQILNFCLRQYSRVLEKARNFSLVI